MNRRTSNVRARRTTLPTGATPVDLLVPAREPHRQPRRESTRQSTREAAQEPGSLSPMVLPWHTASRREHDPASAAPASAHGAGHATTRGALALLEEPFAARFEPSAPRPDAAENTLLLALDDALLADALRDALSIQGDPAWVVQVASDVVHALELAASCPPRLVVLDIAPAKSAATMPDGAAIYYQLRADPVSAHTPVIFATAATSLDLSKRGIQEGLLLRKPFDLSEVVQLVRELLSR